MPQPLTIRELSALSPRLQATIDMLVGAASAPAPASQPKKSAIPAPRAPRNLAPGELQARLVRELKRAPVKGRSLSELAAIAAVERATVKYQLRVLRDGKKVRVRGNRRNARWFAQ